MYGREVLDGFAEYEPFCKEQTFTKMSWKIVRMKDLQLRLSVCRNDFINFSRVKINNTRKCLPIEAVACGRYLQIVLSVGYVQIALKS